MSEWGELGKWGDFGVGVKLVEYSAWFGVIRVNGDNLGVWGELGGWSECSECGEFGCMVWMDVDSFGKFGEFGKWGYWRK